MPSSFFWSRRVEFSETDMAGIVHFTQFFRYMESAEHAFYRSLGFSVVLPHRTPPIGFPRVHASCDYKRPLRFEDTVDIHLIVREKRTRSIAYDFQFFRSAPEPRELVATGRMIIACVTRNPDGTLLAVPLPEDLFSTVTPAPSTDATPSNA